ncbi:MAG TPA: UDP-glucuronic acid decarboxylase family protein [Acidimicrobiia bacterium]|jgi:dTDP-glucose 4,6-dehydratase|nr:UDP-glucuronic acid decarboxylase family protein [Acidimicrobiia bacterium]
MARIVVTGGAGFIGSNLCDALLARGDEVVAVDNLSTGRLQNIAHLAEHPAFSFVRADVCKEMPVEGRVDGVLHFASPASPPEYLATPLETIDVSSLGTRRALDLALANEARFLLASTSEIYGDPEVHPQSESYNGNVDPNAPRAVYDEAKRLGETLTSTYRRQYGLPTAIVRIFNTYGPRLRPSDGRVVSNFLMQAIDGKPMTMYGTGSQTRSFCFVSDEVRGLLALFDSDVCDPVNIGNPDEITMLELVDLVREVAGSTSEVVYEPLPVGDPTRRRPDITRARTLLGWEPTVSLRDGLSLMYAWYLEERSHGRA